MCQASRAPNISATGDRETLKWAHWIGVDGYGGTDLDPEETPVPASPEMYSYYLGRTVSAYQFARMATGVQRGSRSCDTLLAPRNALTRFPNRACRSDRRNGYGVAPFTVVLRRFLVCSDARLAPERSPRLRASVTRSCPSRPCPNRLRRRCSSRAGFGRFRHLRVSGNAHKPLNFQEKTHG